MRFFLIDLPDEAMTNVGSSAHEKSGIEPEQAQPIEYDVSINVSPKENSASIVKEDEEESAVEEGDEEDEEEEENDGDEEEGENATSQLVTESQDDGKLDQKVTLLPRDREDTIDTEDHEEELEELRLTNEQAKEDEEAREKNRQELLEIHKKLLDRRRQAGELNVQLQTKLAEYFRRKKADAAETTTGGAGGTGGAGAGESATSSMIDNAVDFSQRYAKYVATLAEIRKQFLNKKCSFDGEIASLKQKCSDQQEEASRQHQETINYLTNQCRKAVSVRTGRPVTEQDYAPLISILIRKDALVSNVRLESIKMVNEVEKIESIFKSQEDLVEGLHLIDFEQLKIENQTYNEKIEERNEELGKLRRKIINNVQMMTHIKEKLHYCQGENHVLRQQLEQATMMLNRNRDCLTKVKQRRDALRGSYVKLQRSCGLLGNPELLCNFEASMNAADAKAMNLANLKKQTNKYLSRANFFKEKLETFHNKSDRSH